MISLLEETMEKKSLTVNYGQSNGSKRQLLQKKMLEL